MRKALTGFGRVLHPPRWVRGLMPPIAFAALACVFLTGRQSGALACTVYVVSAYCLVILLLPAPKLARSAKAAVMRRISGTAFGGRYMRDLAFRRSVSLYQGTAFDLLYAAFRIVMGVRYTSAWFISMAAYYLALGILRLSLIVSSRRGDKENELSCYRRTAWLLFLLNVPMGGMILLMVLTNAGYSYPGYVVYLSAIYTFYTVAVSAVNLVKYRKLGSPILSAAKALNFIAALMSVLGLQTAMISQFSAQGGSFRRTMNAITGGTVWGAAILIAACMLYRSAKMKEKVNPC